MTCSWEQGEARPVHGWPRTSGTKRLAEEKEDMVRGPDSSMFLTPQERRNQGKKIESCVLSAHRAREELVGVKVGLASTSSQEIRINPCVKKKGCCARYRMLA